MDKYNLEKLVRVVVNDFYPSMWYELKREKKFFGFITQKYGFYSFLGEYKGNNVPKNHIEKDGRVYEKPEVVLVYEGDCSKKYIFDTHEEAVRFADGITKKNGRWI